MHHHHDKSRDMARSVLPSTGRRRARQERAIIHRRERARLRHELHALSRHLDPLDFEGDLTWRDRGEMDLMVGLRRAADKVGPLLRWAEVTIARDPVLRDASPSDREVHFASLLPPGLIGQHAISHLERTLGHRGPGWAYLLRSGRRQGGTWTDEDRDRVAEIVAAGAHGELNRRLRAALGAAVDRDAGPSAGTSIPSSGMIGRAQRPVRYLAGAHDIAAFVADAGLDAVLIVRALHREISR